MNIKIILLLSILVIIPIVSAKYYPEPYYAQDNLKSLREDSWQPATNFMNITNENIQTPYSWSYAGTPTYDFDTQYTLILVNVSTPGYAPIQYYEMEQANVSRYGSWALINDTTFSPFTPSGAYLNSNITGDYLEYNITASSFVVNWRRCPGCGYIDLYINNSLYAQIDTYGTVTRTYTAYNYAQKEMSLNIKLKVGSDKNAASVGYNVSLDMTMAGSNRFWQQIQEKYQFIDGQYFTMKPGTNATNYFTFNRYQSSSWPLIYNLSFYTVVRNPTNLNVSFTIVDSTGTADYFNGTSIITGGKTYCNITIGPNSGWRFLNFTYGSPYCSNQTNGTWAGMMRTFFHSSGITAASQTYRVYISGVNASLDVDSFWVGRDRIMPRISVLDAESGEDLSNGGYVACEKLNNSARGLNITVYNLPPLSPSWVIYLYGSPTTLDFAFNTSVALTATREGIVNVTNFVGTIGRFCGAYDYANSFYVLFANTAASMAGTGGSTFSMATPTILTMPKNWTFPELRLINLNTNTEEYILKPNTNYEFQINISDIATNRMITGMTTTVSFVNMYATEGMYGYENPIKLDGTLSYILSADTTITLLNNSGRGLYVRNFTTPTSWRYDGHITPMRIQIYNASNTAMRFRSNTLNNPLPVQFAVFSNYLYSNSGVDVDQRDLDFGTSSAGHPFYSTSGGVPATYADGVEDVWIEDATKIIMLYQAPENIYTQVPIIWYDKSTGQAHYTAASFWAPGYDYLSSYRQTRKLYAETGQSQDYFVAYLQNANALGYLYNVTFYSARNSDWLEVFYDFPDIYDLSTTFQTLRQRSYGNYRIVGGSKTINTLFGNVMSNHFYYPTAYASQITYLSSYALSNVTPKANDRYLGYSTAIPKTNQMGLNPCYPYCYEFTKTPFYMGWATPYSSEQSPLTNRSILLGQLITEGYDEYRQDSQTWGILGNLNGDLLNSNLRKTKVRYIWADTPYASTDRGDMLKQYDRLWQYGYPASYAGKGIDIYFDKNSKSYNSGETVTSYLYARNYSQLLSGHVITVNIIDENNQIVQQYTKTTNGDGNFTITYIPTSPGIYRVRATNSELFGIGFFWVRSVTQSITTGASTYAPGQTVSISNTVADSTTSSIITNAVVNCTMYNLVGDLVWNNLLSLVSTAYTGNAILNANATTGTYTLTCIANDGVSTDTESIYFGVAATTNPTSAISSVEISAPSVINTNTNFTIETFIRTLSNTLYNCNNVTLTAINSLNGNAVLTDVLMTNRTIGQYYYITNFSSQATYLLQSVCHIGTSIYTSSPKLLSTQNIPGSLTAQSIWEYSNALDTLNNINSTPGGGGSRVTISEFPDLLAGDRYFVVVNAFDSVGGPANLSTSPKITIYDANRELIISNQDMTYSTNGVYNYTYDTLSSAAGGVWESIVTANQSGNIIYLHDYWRISSTVADVVINYMSDITAPTISANAYILNAGNAHSDFEYMYCVVRDQTNQCGGSDDVDYQSGTRLIRAGETWTANFGLTVTEGGTYYFKLKARPLGNTQWAAASKMFDVTATAQPGTGGASAAAYSACQESTQCNIGFNCDQGRCTELRCQANLLAPDGHSCANQIVTPTTLPTETIPGMNSIISNLKLSPILSVTAIMIILIIIVSIILYYRA